ncbi:hypothetical protein NC653_006886 [Populus alba x Populus x berolinensis]|uniref:Uncharacterized protein n=1 Tax=Populus alba x Populus x berolinensis TaxID=444605 RepID=A0AAD6RFB2_9ROSI|nr:hypothetical protein NC653_006886 [Populus alba x Populus x berolinensis]
MLALASLQLTRPALHLPKELRDSDAFLRWQLIDRTDRERARDQDLFDVFSTGNSIRFPYLVCRKDICFNFLVFFLS